jgi:hypothetical protein
MPNSSLIAALLINFFNGFSGLLPPPTKQVFLKAILEPIHFHWSEKHWLFSDAPSSLRSLDMYH